MTNTNHCDNQDDRHCYINHDRAACETNDQLPSIAQVGRGIKGDSTKLIISSPDDCTQTYLECLSYDEATKTYTSEWMSDNINGGELSYQYNLRPYQIPMTFTITFIYRRPRRPEGLGSTDTKYPEGSREHAGINIPTDACYHKDDKDHCWSWTTPAIPYLWSIDEDGNKADAEGIVGSGVATVFMRTSIDDPWSIEKHEKLLYPPGTTRNDYNAPEPTKPWTVNITFGKGGDVELPNFDELAKILGVTKDDLFDILDDNPFTLGGITADNYLDWILKHLHKDLGFEADGSDHGWENQFGGEATVKDYIDKGDQALQDQIDATNDALDAADQHIKNLYGVLNDIISHIYGASVSAVDSGSASSATVADGKGYKITWSPSGLKIPQGNINVLSSTTSNAILTHSGDALGDLKGE